MSKTLKPCPFCGGEAEVFMDTCTCVEDGTSHGPLWFVVCAECPATVCGSDKESAIAAWNKRVEQ